MSPRWSPSECLRGPSRAWTSQQSPYPPPSPNPVGGGGCFSSLGFLSTPGDSALSSSSIFQGLPKYRCTRCSSSSHRTPFHQLLLFLGNFLSTPLVPISKNRHTAGQEASSHVRPQSPFHRQDRSHRRCRTCPFAPWRLGAIHRRPGKLQPINDIRTQGPMAARPCHQF